MSTAGESCLAFVLGDELVGAIVPRKERGDLIVGPIRLLDGREGSFMGFIDWLRTKEPSMPIAGVRFWPHERSYVHKAVAKTLSYVASAAEGKGVIVWFSGGRAYDEQSSGDQAFAFARVVVSEDGATIGFVLGLDGLSREELQGIQNLVRFEEAVWS